ncbi:hypothetical protein SUGI_1188720 [Cryptomeria japonica]|uniref:transcription factor bHLH118 n=1 Tax=Cryptomeria japonica TaxID=3369 RepID=UPI0024147FBF|nr:transcription factor bHLH118 [Cryptomeria japonica]GLJ55375.1 hypothetical protein SUGI_1188720 [Cryptomeria japonica]
MNAFPHEFSAFLSSTNVQSGQSNYSLPQFCFGDVQTGLDIVQCGASNKFGDDGKQRKRREGVDKKWLHKVIERERRKQMKSRYSDLRSLLPQEIIVGKSSLTDQLSVATDYIRHLQEKVEELTKKRDEMKMSEMQYYKVNNDISFRKCDAFPLVNVNHVGSLVLITTNTLRKQMALSRLLLVVEEEGLHIISASSFTADDKVYHTLHCKLFDKKRFTGGTKLEQRLWQLIDRNYILDVSKS